MIKIGVKQVRQNLTKYLGRVQQGEEVIITRRDEPIAKLVPISRKKSRSLRSHAEVREMVSSKGKPLSQLVEDMRKERL